MWVVVRGGGGVGRWFVLSRGIRTNNATKYGELESSTVMLRVWVGPGVITGVIILLAFVRIMRLVTINFMLHSVTQCYAGLRRAIIS
jgi:hypothetical protein